MTAANVAMEQVSMAYFQQWLEENNQDGTQRAIDVWRYYEAVTDGVNDEDFYKCKHKFNGNEKEETATFYMMLNSLIDYGPLSPNSDYVVCRCGKVVNKKDHWAMRRPNAEVCIYCRDKAT